MSYRGWHSKKQVLKDVARATGTKVRDFDENYVLCGEQPPPTRYTLDEEMEIQLSRLYGGNKDRPQEIGKPDLAGITEMLRMLDNYYDDPVQENPTVEPTQENTAVKSTQENTTVENKKNTIISISKLNPNIDEFVPKHNGLSNKEVLRNAHVKGNDNEVIHERVDNDHTYSNSLEYLKETNKTEGYVLDNLIDNPINISELTQEEVHNMRKKLKAHINGTSNMNCAKVKRQRNLAIATLVKLYSQQVPKTEEVKPKLISPDYYKKCVSDNSKKEPIGDIADEIFANGKASTPEFKNYEVNKEAIKNMTQSHNSNFITDTEHETIVKNEKDIAASVDKVEKWLSSSDNRRITSNEVKNKNPKIEKPMNNLVSLNNENKESRDNNGCVGNNKIGSPIYLGPITFKRKVGSKPMSPTSTDSQEKNKVMKTSNFVPSKYASELAEKYMKRDALRKSLENDIWTNLEIKLKARDEEIRNGQKSLQSKANDENLLPNSKENLNSDTFEVNELM